MTSEYIKFCVEKFPVLPGESDVDWMDRMGIVSASVNRYAMLIQAMKWAEHELRGGWVTQARVWLNRANALASEFDDFNGVPFTFEDVEAWSA